MIWFTFCLGLFLFFFGLDAALDIAHLRCKWSGPVQAPFETHCRARYKRRLYFCVICAPPYITLAIILWWPESAHPPVTLLSTYIVTYLTYRIISANVKKP